MRKPAIYDGFKIKRRCDNCCLQPESILDCIQLCRTYWLIEKENDKTKK